MNHRQFRNRLGALLLGAAVLGLGGVVRPAHGDECGDVGRDGAFSGGGTVNTYYPPAANGSIGPLGAPGTTTLSLGTPTGFSTTLFYGAMLLIMQMQDAEINTNDDNRYGDGVQEVSPTPDLGTGSLHINGTGLYEFVIVDDGVTPFGPTSGAVNLASVPIKGTGPFGGLVNTYTNATSTATLGQKRYQVIRVPQYSSLTLNSALSARPWDGSTGGVLAVDVSGDVVLNNATVNLTGTGFRGGFGEKLSSGASIPKTTYRRDTSINAFGNKGEGIVGTPKNIAPGTVNPEGEGYPSGSRARGAPGNAGGGGNPDDPSTNTDSSGGGGGGNGGAGGQGGNTGNSNLSVGGFGGSPFLLDDHVTRAWAANRIIMGGGGGSGTKNNTNPGSSDGGAGGGILIIRANKFSRGGSGTQTATFTVNGAAGADGGNNGGGGGGAGGTVILSAVTGSLAGVTINARGGNGGDAGTGTNKYGPGGGGGGGVVLAFANNATVHTEAGNNGLTNGDIHGAGDGVTGSPNPDAAGNPLILPGDIPGVHSGAECLVYKANDDPNYITPLNVTLNVAVGAGVLANDQVPVGFAATAVKDTDPPVSEGTVTLNADGSFQFVPATGFVGNATFTYHLNNATLGDSNIATVTISCGQNVAPDAASDTASTAEDTPLSVAAPGVLSNDSDPNGDGITAVLDTTTTHGTLTLNSDGSFDYSPDPNYNGPDSFTYHATDGSLNSATVTVSITVTPVNDDPVATGDSYQVVHDTTLTVVVGGTPNGVLANDTDVDGDPLTAVLDMDVTHGTLALAADGSFTYTPDPAYTGPDSFTYHANDGTADSGTVTVNITVLTSNAAPIALDDAYTTRENKKLVVLAAAGVLANDSDPDGTTPTAVLDIGTANGTLSLGADGSFTYTPNKKFAGIDTFKYHATDGIASSAVVTVTITVLPAADHFKAGYCGSTGVDLLLPLGLLWLYRRVRNARTGRSSRCTT